MRAELRAVVQGGGGAGDGDGDGGNGDGDGEPTGPLCIFGGRLVSNTQRSSVCSAAELEAGSRPQCSAATPMIP